MSFFCSRIPITFCCHVSLGSPSLIFVLMILIVLIGLVQYCMGYHSAGVCWMCSSWLDRSCMFAGGRPEWKCQSHHIILRIHAFILDSSPGWGPVCQFPPLYSTLFLLSLCCTCTWSIPKWAWGHPFFEGEIYINYLEFFCMEYLTVFPIYFLFRLLIYVSMDIWILMLHFGL